MFTAGAVSWTRVQICSGVAWPSAVDGVQHQLALRRHPQAAAVQRLPQFGVHLTDRRPPGAPPVAGVYGVRRRAPTRRVRVPVRAPGGAGPYDRDSASDAGRTEPRPAGR